MATVLAKGQLSYLILSCLEEKDMYGLELIDEIKNRSGFEIKLPSLYSNINRMKELKFISSYLKESNKGPKCSYSSITELGRIELKKLKEVFETNTNEAVTDCVKDNSSSEEQVKMEDIAVESVKTCVMEETVDETKETNKDEIKNSFDDYDDFFADIPGDDETEENNQPEEENEESIEEELCPVQETPTQEIDLVDKPNEVVEENLQNEDEDESDVTETSNDMENITESIEKLEVEKTNESTNEIEENSAVLQEEIKVEELDSMNSEVKNDAVFLTNDIEAQEYNKKLFDVSKDYYKYKKKNSFSENQIQMVVNSNPPIEDKIERKNENINNLKEALLRSKQGNYEEISLTPHASNDTDKSFENEEKITEEFKDDGVFITDRVDYIPKTKRFEPPKIILNNDNIDLPAPKRNTQIDPNCSDVKAKIDSLFKKAQNEVSHVVEDEPMRSRENIYETYDDLKEYYSEQNISFKVFKRTDKRKLHNTNKISFFVDLIMFGLIGVGSAILYLIFSQLGLTNPDTNFMYYLFPILYFIYLGFRFYSYKKITSKVPKPLFNFIVIFGTAILLCGFVFCLNLAGGMSINAILDCSTTVFLPMFIIIMIVIVRHYLMLFSLKKYWK